MIAAIDAGKYAAFIWPAYAVTALVFAWMVIDTWAAGWRWRRRLRALEKERDT